MGKRSAIKHIWVVRLCIGIPLFFNLLCAASFLLWPGAYIAAFELAGTPGLTAVYGVGLLFLMWNVPYLFAFVDPICYQVSLIEACLMQTIGLGGETILYITHVLAQGHPYLSESILRFIKFDSFGLIFLVLAFILTVKLSRAQSTST